MLRAYSTQHCPGLVCVHQCHDDSRVMILQRQTWVSEWVYFTSSLFYIFTNSLDPILDSACGKMLSILITDNLLIRDVCEIRNTIYSEWRYHQNQQPKSNYTVYMVIKTNNTNAWLKWVQYPTH